MVETRSQPPGDLEHANGALTEDEADWLAWAGPVFSEPEP
jgi:hypothetical protein